MRATWWPSCEAIAFWEVPRYCDVVRHTAEEYTLFFSLKMVSLAMLLNTLLYVDILTDFNYATLTSPYIFEKTVECKLPLLP